MRGWAALVARGAPAGGALAGADGEAAGATAEARTQHGASVCWAYSIPPETASKAAIANQRPRPLANTFMRTNSTLMR